MFIKERLVYIYIYTHYTDVAVVYNIIFPIFCAISLIIRAENLIFCNFRWKQSVFIPTPEPYFQTLYSDCHGDFKVGLVSIILQYTYIIVMDS